MKNASPGDVSSNPQAICERLKQVRVQVCGPRGQSHFAALLQLSPSTYNYYEKGRIPPVDVLDRASRITNVPLLWLIRGEPSDFVIESLKRIEAQPSAEGSVAPVSMPAPAPTPTP
jgi:transcriptional regulator with XRE-family HTH domain